MPNRQQLLQSADSPLTFNHEALAILLAHTLKCQKEQTFVLAGPEDLRALLPALRLHDEGDEVFLLYRPYIHSMAIYLRFELGRVNAFLFDPQSWGLRYYPNRLAVAYLQQAFPMLRLILSGDMLQSQSALVGCDQYSLFFLDYIAKQGHTWFTTVAIESNCQLVEAYPNIEIMQPGRFPKALQEISMQQNEHWVSNYQEYNYRQLDAVLTHYADAADNCDWQKIYSTVQTMQGYALPARSPLSLLPSLLNITTPAPGTVCLQSASWRAKDYYLYANALLFSAEDYPMDVRASELQCVLNQQGIQVNLDPETFTVTLRSDSADILSQQLDKLFCLEKEALWAAKMRQWSGLQALIQEIQSALVLAPICQDNEENSGGFYQDQIQMALRFALANHDKIYVPDISIIAGDTACLCLRSLFEEGFTQVAFTCAADATHQVAVWVDLDANGHQVSVYDSLERSELTSSLVTHLTLLLGLNERDRITLQPSFYAPQQNDWSCGTFVFASIMRLAGDATSFLWQPQLDNQRTAASIYRCWQRDLKQHEHREAENVKHQQKAHALLQIVEQYRDQQAHYSCSDNDVLQPLADALQRHIWGNLDRRPLATHQQGRAMEASPARFGLPLSRLKRDNHNPIAKLVLDIADQCQNLSTFNWQQLFTWITDTQEQLECKEINDTVYMLAGDCPPARYQALSTCILDAADDKVNALQQAIQFLYQSTKDCEFYLNGIATQHHGTIPASAICLRLLIWLAQQHESAAQHQQNSDRRRLAEQKAVEDALKNWFTDALNALEITPEEQQHFFDTYPLTPALRAMFTLLPKPLFRQLDGSSKQKILQTVVSMPRLPITDKEDEITFVLQSFVFPSAPQQPVCASSGEYTQPIYELFLHAWLKQLIDKRMLYHFEFLRSASNLTQLRHGLAMNLFSREEFFPVPFLSAGYILPGHRFTGLLSGLITIPDFLHFTAIPFTEDTLNTLHRLQEFGLPLSFFRTRDIVLLSRILENNMVELFEREILTAATFIQLPNKLALLLTNPNIQLNLKKQRLSLKSLSHAFNKGVINTPFNFGKDNMRALLTDTGLRLLCKNHFKISDLQMIMRKNDIHTQEKLLTPAILIGMERGYIGIQDLPLPTTSRLIVEAINDGLLTVEALRKLPILHDTIFIDALRVGTLSCRTLLKAHLPYLQRLSRNQFGKLALAQGLIRSENWDKLSVECRTLLLHPVVLANIARHLVTEEEVIRAVEDEYMCPGILAEIFKGKWKGDIIGQLFTSPILQALQEGTINNDFLRSIEGLDNFISTPSEQKCLGIANLPVLQPVKTGMSKSSSFENSMARMSFELSSHFFFSRPTSSSSQAESITPQFV